MSSSNGTKLVKGKIENVKDKFFLRESIMFNTYGSNKLKTIYYETHKITSSEIGTYQSNNEEYYYIHEYQTTQGDFFDLITKDETYWNNFNPENNRILKFTRNTKTGEFSDFVGESNSYKKLEEALNIMSNNIISSTEEYNKATAPEFIVFSCFLKSMKSIVQFRIPNFENLNLNSIEDFIHGLNLKIADNDDPKNFAIVPIMTSSHISLMIIDLRKSIEIENRIKHLDNSLAHYNNSILKTESSLNQFSSDKIPMIDLEFFKSMLEKN